MSRIPKKIHYCWLSGEAIPPMIQRCMDSWSRFMPDYELVHWDMARAEQIHVRFLQEALRTRSWAFASDYLRLHALATEGGVYLDSDVEVLKSFDCFMMHGAFSGVEHWAGMPNGLGIEGAIIGAESGHPWILSCLQKYDSKPFLREDGSKDEMVISGVIAGVAKEGFGFKFEPVAQDLANDLKIYAPVTFTHVNGIFSEVETHAIHRCAASWKKPIPAWKRCLGIARQKVLRKFRAQ